MLSIFRAFKSKNWETISEQKYRQAWQQFGGSVATHPDVVANLSHLAGIKLEYKGVYKEGQLIAALPVWGKHLALSKAVLNKQKKRHFFDLGNAEIIFPQRSNSEINLNYKARYISNLNAEAGCQNLREQKEGLALARKPEDYSRKFRYNQRRERRLLEEAGGKVLSVSSLSVKEQAEIYTQLFEKRWEFAVPAKEYLVEVFEIMQPFITGSFITINDQPAAYQVLYRVEAPLWHSVEYINGGVDPDLNELSPGSVLSFVNTQDEWEYARAQNKDLRYSFGRADREYKDRWCDRVSVFES